MSNRFVSYGTVFEDRFGADGVWNGRARFSAVGVYPYLVSQFPAQLQQMIRDAGLFGEVVHVARLPEDVFDPASIATAQMLPVTYRHPGEFLDSENTDQFKVGHIGDTVTIEDGRALVAAMRVDVQRGTDAIKSRRAEELSPGYHADILIEDGEFEGKAYQLRQVNIRYNHIALEPRGRQGRGQRILDSAADLAAAYERLDEPQETKMAKRWVNVAGVRIELEDAEATVVETAERTRLESAGRLAAVPTRDAMEATIRADIQRRSELEGQASKVLGSSWSPAGKTDRAIKLEVVAKTLPHVKLTDAHEDGYVDGVFMGALAAAPIAQDRTGSSRGVQTGGAQPERKDVPMLDAEESRKSNPYYMDLRHNDSEQLYDQGRRELMANWRMAGTSPRERANIEARARQALAPR